MTPCFGDLPDGDNRREIHLKWLSGAVAPGTVRRHISFQAEEAKAGFMAHEGKAWADDFLRCAASRVAGTGRGGPYACLSGTPNMLGIRYLLYIVP